MAESQIQEIKQLVVKSPAGEIIDVGLMNNKSYSKSIERNQLWVVHRETGRVLPYPHEHIMQHLASNKNWYEAEIQLSSAEGTEETSQDESYESEIPAAARRGMRSPLEDEAGDEEFLQSPDEYEYRAAGMGLPCGSVFEAVEDIVRRRSMEMPEGSYTTHLFASGAEKIRKKTGEEAVELILAQSKEQIVYEAADLLYHLSVLLVSEGLSYQDVCVELQSRYSSSGD